jgi:2-methylisocitrate lyase-like PEP mutase family enzyme
MNVMSATTPGSRLRDLLARDGTVLAVLGTPSARYAKIMDHFGTEAAFVGTSVTFGNYTGLPDSGVASAPECVAIGGHIARAVSYPVILDGDTGHGGRGAVRRLVADAVREGLAGLRLDDQPLEGKRRTQDAGIEVASLAAAVERYQWAVQARDEIDPSFVIMAQCYARDAVNGGMDELLARLAAYEGDGGADWVQFEAPHHVSEIEQARERVRGTFSAMKGRLPQVLSLAEHAALGLNAAWYTFLPSRVLMAACADFMADFGQRGIAAWTEFERDHAKTVATDGTWL